MGIIYKNGIPYGNQPSIDATLTHQGEAADAKATGDAVSELRNTLKHKADVIYDTASGDIASFPDGADGLPVKDLTVGIEPVQSGTGDPSPTNVRPISGWTGCNVTRTGKNLFDENLPVKSGYLLNGSGEEVANSSYQYTEYFTPVKPNTNYIFSGRVVPSGVYNSVCFYDVSKNFLSRFAPSSGGVGAAFTTPYNCHYIRFNVGDNNNFLPETVQLEEGSTATAYQAFGTTIPISWQSSAGTVYGGTLDVTTGVLTVTWGKGNIFYDYNWNYSRSNDWWFLDSSTPSINGIKLPTSDNLKANVLLEEYVTLSYNEMSNSQALYSISVASNGQVRFRDRSISGTSYNACKYVTNNLQLVYELATPQTYQLDPVTVNTLIGQNNIWADTGDGTVEYPCDTKLYIERLTAPSDDDMIADANIASGKYFIVNNNLYLSTAAILAGDPIKPGTNCTLTNLAAALNALNS